MFKYLFGGAEAEVKQNLRRLAGNEIFWRHIIDRTANTTIAFRKFGAFANLAEISIVEYLEHRLDEANGLPRLERLETCAARGPFGKTYLSWYGAMFNTTPRVVPRSVRLCTEIEKI